MAITSIGDRSTGVAGASASTTVSMAPSATIAVDRILLVTVVSPTATVDSVTDTGGNTYTRLADHSGNSQSCEVWFTKVTTQLTTGSTITATFSASIAEKCIGAWEFSVGAGNTLQESTAEVDTSTTAANGYGSAAHSGLASLSRLYWRGLCKNANATTAITATTNFTSAGWAVRSRNNAAARTVRAEFRINTSTGETSNPTFANTGSTAAVFLALEEYTPPVNISPSPAGTLVGAASPALSADIGASAAGVLVGANAPTLDVAVTITPSTAGLLVGVGPGVADTAVAGIDATADILSQQTDVPASLITAFTVAGWFYRTSNANDGSPFSVYDSGSGYNKLLITGGTLRVGSNLGGIDVASVPAGAWYFAAMTQSGATRQLTGYVAALGAGTMDSAVHTSINNSDPVTDVFVGGAEVFGSSIQGRMRSVRVWNYALSSTELDAERASSSPVATSGLTGHYPLLSAASKLSASVGTNLVTTGAGSWTDDDGPFIAAGLTLTFGPDVVTPDAAGTLVGANAPALATTLEPTAPGLLVGAVAPVLQAPLDLSPAGVAVGATAPTLATTISPTAAGVSVGATAPELAASLEPTPAGLLVGASAPALATTVSPEAAGGAVGANSPALATSLDLSPAGVAVGAQGPALAVSVEPTSAGVLAGANSPSLTTSLAADAAGVLAGGWAPSLSASVSPSPAGVSVGAWSASVAGGAVSLSPTPAGAEVGAWAPELATVVAPDAAGAMAGASSPTLGATLSSTPSGLLVGAWSPSLSVSLVLGTAGVAIGVPAPSVGEVVPHYVTPGELARITFGAGASAQVAGTTATASPTQSSAAATVANSNAGATPT